MNPLDIFNINKPFERVVIRGPSSRKYVPTDMSALDNELYKGTRTPNRSVNGTDYVAAYVKEEETKLLKSVNGACNGEDGNRFDEMTQATTPDVNEISDHDLTKIYKAYNFAYRPKVNLTVVSMKDQIVSMIETNPVTVIEGPTGCGKTTQVPQFILDSCFKKKVHCNIIVTQPRRIAAISIANRVSSERQWPLGTLVGYQIGMINHTSADTRLTYCTTGVLLHKLINAKHMLDYTHVILDEVHERDQEMDFLLLVVRKLLRSNSRAVKVILMSATFNVEKFSTYFSSPCGNKFVPAPIIDIAKKTYFNVNTYYLCQMGQLGPLPEVSAEKPYASREMMYFCERLAIIFDTIDYESACNDGSKKSDDFDRHVILIFLPGIYEIEEMHNILTNPKHKSTKWDVVVLHSMITNEEQQHIFNKPPIGHRRIILSTNIAESSITVPNVKYVIDFCLTKQLVTDKNSNYQCLELTWASKTNCEQRAGRTGRVMDGRVYRLVPKYFYENILEAEGAPEILRAPLERLVLNSKLLDMGEPKAILALSLDPPDLSNLELTILLLKEVGALLHKFDESQQFDGELTDLGRVMANLPVDIHIAKLITLGHVFSVLRDTIIIGAGMAVKSMFSAPFQKKLQAYNAKLTWAARSCSDCIAFLNVYNVWIHEKANRRLNSSASEKSWAQRNFIQIRVLREVEALVHDITARLKRLGICESLGVNKVVWNEIERPFVLKIVIAGAFYPHYFVNRQLQDARIDERDSVKLLGGLDPTKTVYLQGWPTKQPGLLYAQRIQRNFIECLSSSVGNVKVSFDGSSRAYIQFSKMNQFVQGGEAKPEIPGRVSLSVYMAIKMRQIGYPIVVPVLDQETAAEKAKELNLISCTTNTFLKRNVQFDVPTLRPVLPGIDVSFIPLVILNFIDPGHFWAHLKDGDTWNNMKTIESIINGTKGILEKFNSPPEIGALVIAPYSIRTIARTNVKYYRAIVQSYSRDSQNIFAQVFFIDYGHSEQINLCDLRQLANKDDIADIPALAFECVLSNIRPSVLHNLNGLWSESAFDEFGKLIGSHVNLFGEVYSVVNSVVSLNLLCVNVDDEQINVNKYLIERGYAEFREEDYLSRNNHELREQRDDMTSEDQKYYEELQYDQNYALECYPESPSKLDCSSQVTLRGPYSPLEIELMHLTTSGSKKVHVEWNSVNSVLLDTNPEDLHNRLLVAGTIGQTTCGDLMLRNTTLMPNLPGLTALLCLIFTPQMELRRSDIGTRYTGALCGLGFDPTTNVGLFPEHDLQITFDAEITIDDMQDINRLRHWMNMGIHTYVQSENCDDMSEITVCQNKVKDSLFKLIKKKRNPQKPDANTISGKWNRYDESLLLQPGRIGVIKSNIYKLHCALELENRNEELEEMAAHVEDLRNRAIENVRSTAADDVLCKLCNKNVFGVFDLRAHLHSVAHRQNEERLGLQRR